MTTEHALAGRSAAISNTAVATHTVLFAYFLITNYADLYPWNNLTEAGSQLASTISGAVPFLLAVVGFGIWRNRWLALVAAVYSWVWLGLQIAQWWPGYLTGGESAWYVDGGYGETIKWLPRIGDNTVIIDAQHTVLQSLSLIAAVVSTLAAVSIWHQARRLRAP